MKRILPGFIGIIFISIVGFAFFLHSKNVSAAPATHLVISEVQIAGFVAGDDFIEIYNPTSSEINLGDFRLVKRTSGGATDDSIVAFEADDVIPAHGYFLWCNSNITVALSCDRSTSATVANNNSVGIREGALDTGVLIDALSFGTVTNSLGEGTSLTAPTASTSVERKANSTSTEISMGIGGADEFMGNAEDTDNNSLDFVSRDNPQPQNSSSSLEPVPTPTQEPSPTPSAEPSPTPTIEPSVTPTNIPSPTITPLPTASPTPTIIPSPTPTPSENKLIFRNFIISCTMNFKPLKVFNKTYFFPIISCKKASK